MTLLETLDKLERLAEKATPGPWRQSKDYKLSVCDEEGGLADTFIFHTWRSPEIRLANAEFIAETNPATILRLIKAMREMRGALQSVAVIGNPNATEVSHWEARPHAHAAAVVAGDTEQAREALLAADAAFAGVEK